jgi:hypothetical protein
MTLENLDHCLRGLGQCRRLPVLVGDRPSGAFGVGEEPVVWSGVESEGLVKAYLNDAVRRDTTGPVDDLKHSLAADGVEAGTTATNTKLPVPAAPANGTGHHPERSEGVGRVYRRPGLSTCTWTGSMSRRTVN